MEPKFDDRSNNNIHSILLQQAEAKASRDHLTGLPNRMALDKALLGLTHRLDFIGEGSSLAAIGVAYLDINYFKNINDTGGHSKGDEAAKIVARRLEESIKAGDAVYRPNAKGDEFVIVFPIDKDLTEEEFKTIIIDRIQNKVNKD